jgi:hypothetical protein
VFAGRTLGGPALDQFDGVVVGVGDPRHAQIAEPVVGLGEHSCSRRHQSSESLVRVIGP